ncbi:primosomal protein N' [Piscinibacter sp. SJAQ100]|uniref:Replication restart protein PriA n=1 Tax=Aquariibacter albus TaxID=2759899 RepID=A0A839HJW2_9BURK|nr:primosomal protein N' [Aquariibacter albus]
MSDALNPCEPVAAGVLGVLVETPQHSGLSGPLDYVCDRPVAPGTLLRVPLGRREVLGIAWTALRPAEAPAAEGWALRPLAAVFDRLPPLPPAWRALVDFAARYYQRGAGELALAVLPAELRKLDAIQLDRRLRRLDRAAAAAPPAAGPAPERPALTPEQAAVLAALGLERIGQAGAEPPVTLLDGVTGSGKTEVYLRAAETVLAGGRQVLMLVPEINLTPQLEARVAARFPARRILSLHSGLSPALRLRHWLQVLRGEVDLLLGTRMAIFAPLDRLGLLVIDEEHDPSYKQQDGARYSARDLAVLRGRLERAAVLLASATPSLESWHNARPQAEGGAGRYQRLAMPSRIGGGVLPRVRLLDLGQLRREDHAAGLIAPALVEALQQRLARGEQSLVLLNRRGYAPVLHCAACGWKSGCPHCSAWRVFHKSDRSLRCHHCGATERVPRHCPECGNADLDALGRGTERLADELAERLPGARIGRIDADSTRAAGSLEAQLAQVHAGDIDVLVGTQMVAKGHDFRRITLVAAVQPDAALFSSDFRAPERLFSLLMQAAGRAGREASQSGQSEMWVQTWHPAHPLYQALLRHDAAAFAEAQWRERFEAGLPPATHLALLRAEARTQEAAQAWLAAAATLGAAAAAEAGVVCFPPVPTPVQRVAQVERAQMLIEAPRRAPLQQMLAAWLPQLHGLREPRVLRWAIDVDPLAI